MVSMVLLIAGLASGRGLAPDSVVVPGRIPMVVYPWQVRETPLDSSAVCLAIFSGPMASEALEHLKALEFDVLGVFHLASDESHIIYLTRMRDRLRATRYLREVPNFYALAPHPAENRMDRILFEWDVDELQFVDNARTTVVAGLRLSEGFFSPDGFPVGPGALDQIRPLVRDLFVNEVRTATYPCPIEEYVVHASREQLRSLGERDLVLSMFAMHTGPCGPPMAIRRSQRGTSGNGPEAGTRYLPDGRRALTGQPAFRMP